MATVTKMCDLIDTTGGTGPFTTPSFTPPAGSLLVFLINAGATWNNSGNPILTDTDGGGWWHSGNVQFDEAGGDGGYESMRYAVRTSAVSGASMTLSISASGVTQECVIATVLAVEGMVLFGSNAVVQDKWEPNRAQTGVPSLMFDAPCSRANPVIAWLITDSAPPNTAPPTGFTEWTDDYVTGQTIGMHAASIDGGFTGPTVPYTQDPDGYHRAGAIELDTTGGIPWTPGPSQIEAIGLNSFEIKVLTGR